MDKSTNSKDEAKLWGGRFESGMDAVMEQFNASLSFDKRLFAADIFGSIAYAQALHDINLITKTELDSIQFGLKQTEEEWKSGKFVIKDGDEDIHTANERRLKEIIGIEIGGKLHTGRSRNDQIATDMRIWLRDGCYEIMDLLVKFINVLITRSENEIDILMPGYTHLQRAQPVLWSHWLLSFAWMLQQDYLRLKSCLNRMNICPLGSGALAGNPFDVNRETLAKQLGFTSPSHNSMHAVADRDFICEFQFWASLTAVHFSKLAEDLIIYSTKEFGFVKISDAFSTGSSLMPQKKNADSLELIRGKTGRIIGNSTGLLVVLKGLPSTFNKDLQEDKEGMFDTFDTIIGIIKIATGTVSTLKIFKDKCYNALTSDMLATDIAYYLVRKGVPFRMAHEIAGKVVATSESLKCDITNLSLEILKQISDKFSEDIKELWNFENSVNQYKAKGGTSVQSVINQIQELKNWISEIN